MICKLRKLTLPKALTKPLCMVSNFKIQVRYYFMKIWIRQLLMDNMFTLLHKFYSIANYHYFSTNWNGFLAHLAKGQVSFCHHMASVCLTVCLSVPPSYVVNFNLVLRNHWANCIQTLVEWYLYGPLPNCVRWSRFPTKMATKLKIEKRGDEILIVHCCYSISQNELHGKE